MTVDPYPRYVYRSLFDATIMSSMNGVDNPHSSVLAIPYKVD